MKSDSILKQNIDYLKFTLRLSLKDLSSILEVKYETFYYQYHHVSALPKETIAKLAELAGVDADVFITTDLRILKGEPAGKVMMLPAQPPQVEVGEILIPMVSQKLSAGYGEEMIAPEDMEYKTLNLMQKVAPGIPKNSLMCAEVRGDSMIDEKIYPGDIVVFAQGVISGNGIYVLSIDNELFVKRLEFDPLSHTITIISANENYKPKTAKDDDQSLRVIGIVTGWFHANRIF